MTFKNLDFVDFIFVFSPFRACSLHTERLQCTDAAPSTSAEFSVPHGLDASTLMTFTISHEQTEI